MYEITERFMRGNSVVAYSLIDRNGMMSRMDKNTVISLADAGMLTNAKVRTMNDGTDRLVGVGCMLSNLSTWRLVTEKEREREREISEPSRLDEGRKQREEIIALNNLMGKIRDKLSEDYTEHSIYLVSAEISKSLSGFEIIVGISAFGGVTIMFTIKLPSNWRNNGRFLIFSDVDRKEIRGTNYSSMVDRISTFIAYSCIKYGLGFEEDDIELRHRLIKDLSRLNNKMKNW